MSTEFEEFVERKSKEISERILAESRAKGRAEGKAEIAATLLKEKLLSPEEIERVSGIPIDQVREAVSKYCTE